MPKKGRGARKQDSKIIIKVDCSHAIDAMSYFIAKLVQLQGVYKPLKLVKNK